MGDAGAMQRAQRRLGGAEIGGVAVGLGDMQRHAIDPAAHQRLASGKQQRRRDAERPGNGERAALAAEQQRSASTRLHHGTSSSRRSTASTSPPSVRKRPRSMVENTSRLSTTPLLPTPAKFRRFVACDHAHPSSTRTASLGRGGRAPPIQASRSASARAHNARFLATFLGPSPPSAAARAARGGS